MSELNWSNFYSALMRLGPLALSGLPEDMLTYIQFLAVETDEFWSDELFEQAMETWEQSPEEAVCEAFETFGHNVRCAFFEAPLAWCAGWDEDPATGESLSIEESVQRIKVDASEADRIALLMAGNAPEG